MEISDLEAEIVTLRGERDTLETKAAQALEREAELTRRNVSLYEKLRYMEHSLKPILRQLTELLANGVDAS